MISLIPASQAPQSLFTVLSQAASDSALANTSVPILPTIGEAEAWVGECGWEFWVVLRWDIPVGYIGLHAPELSQNPEPYAGMLEADMYLLPNYRGERIAGRVWALLMTHYPPGTRFVAEIWLDNTRSIRAVQRDGWNYEGKYHWQSTTNPQDEGWVHRFTFTSGQTVPPSA